MKSKTYFGKMICVASFSALIMISCSSGKRTSGNISLEKDWTIQSSAKVAEKGDIISGISYVTKDWIPTSIPATVMGALADNGIYKDVYFAKNLESINSEPFKTSWWFRKTCGPAGRPGLTEATFNLPAKKGWKSTRRLENTLLHFVIYLGMCL